MCDICGITKEMLPDIYESFEVTGKLLPEWGLTNAVLCAGASDNAAAAVGTCTLYDGESSISLGTSGTVFLSCEQFAQQSTAKLHNFAHANGKFHLMGCILSAASCNKWWTEDILNKDYFEIDESRYGRTGIYFLPYLTGERCPHNDVNARGAFIGLNINTKAEDMSLAVLEGVGYALRDCIEARDQRIDKAVIYGGGAKSKVWQTVISNILGADIYVTATEQRPAYGASLLAITAAGVYTDIFEAARANAKKTLSVKCVPELTGIYSKGYEVYRKIYPAIRDIFEVSDE